jgi:two-component system NtrC family response regulator
MVRRKLFRKDLLFRIRSLTIALPPLRERTADIKDLVEHHMAQLCKEYGIEKKEFSPEFVPALARYDWPGNVRELIKALESAIISARHEPMIFPKHLPTEIRAKMARTSVGDEGAGTREHQTITDVKQMLPGLQALREAAVAEVEKNYLEELMSATRGDIREACRISGLSRSRLYELLKKHHVSTSR